MSGRDDESIIDDAGTTNVIDVVTNLHAYTALPRPRVSTRLHTTDNTSQRHMRRDGWLAAVARVHSRLRDHIYIHITLVQPLNTQLQTAGTAISVLYTVLRKKRVHGIQYIILTHTRKQAQVRVLQIDC